MGNLLLILHQVHLALLTLRYLILSVTTLQRLCFIDAEGNVTARDYINNGIRAGGNTTSSSAVTSLSTADSKFGGIASCLSAGSVYDAIYSKHSYLITLFSFANVLSDIKSEA